MGLRESTNDVDVISKIDADFEIAIGYVSVAENLSLKWLNSSAGAFVPQDFVDLVSLWPRCSFENAAMAVKRYWTAYPVAYADEFLEEFVGRIADSAI